MDLERPGIVDHLDLRAEGHGEEPVLVPKLDADAGHGVVRIDLDTGEPALLDLVRSVMADRGSLGERRQIVEVRCGITRRRALAEGRDYGRGARKGGGEGAGRERHGEDEAPLIGAGARRASTDIEHEARPGREG